GLALLAHFGWKSTRSSGQHNNLYFNWMGWFGLAALTAAVYNLVWGLPFVEFLRNSNFEHGSSWYQDLEWGNLATFFYPFALGSPRDGDYYGTHYWVATY